MADRQGLVRDAVAFLSDPKTQAAPLAQRIQFLEQKGLTSAEIEESMNQSRQSQQLPAYSYGAPYGAVPYNVYPPTWDWRDYFITAVVSGAVMTGAASLARKYLLPHLQPPTTTAYEADRDALTAQFDAAEALLKEIKAETAAVRQAVEEQKEKVDKTTEEVDAAVKEMREGESKTRDEMREIRAEVTNIQEMLPKMIEKSKESEKQSMAELQQELKSLKALLLSRNTSLPSAPASPMPMFTGRPTIPAWQLAGAGSSSAPDPKSSAGSPAPSPAPAPTSATSNDKGKAPALDTIPP